MRFISLLAIAPLITASELYVSNGDLSWDQSMTTQTADTGVTDGGGLMPFSNPAGQTFLEGNKNAPGVGELKNGLQLKICQAGTGTQSPMPDALVTLHYASWSAEEYSKVPRGEPFDSSFKRGTPNQVTPRGIILGLGIALTNLMREGDVFMLYMPSKLAYGEDGSPDGTVPGGTVVVTQVQFISLDGQGQEYLGVGDAPVGGCDPLPSTGSGKSSSGNMYGAMAGVVLVLFGIAYFAKQNQNKERTAAPLPGVPPPGGPPPGPPRV